jgi:hypothetical protein
MISRGKYLFLFVFLCVVSMSACTQERQPCLTPTQSTLIAKAIHFKTPAATTTTDTLLPNPVLGAITDSGNKYYLYSGTGTLKMWLSPLADSTRWLIEPDSMKAAPDTITFYYKRNLDFVSNACGYSYTYELKSATSTHKFIDSLRIINPNVTTNVNTYHVEIYIHPGS